MRIQTVWVLLSPLLLLYLSCSPFVTIRIGYLGSLRGMDSQVGVEGRNGCELAVDEINRSGGIKGKKIELIIGDAGEGPDDALKATMDLYRKGVVAIIAQTTSNPLINVFGFINSNKLLLFSTTAGSDVYINRNDYFFRMVLPVEKEARTLATFAYSTLRIKNITIAYDLDNLVFSRDFNYYFKKQFDSLGGRIIGTEEFRFHSPESIYDAAVKIAGNDGTGGVMIVANSMQVALYCQILAKTRPNLPLLTTRWAFNENLIDNGGKTTSRLFLTGEFDNDCTNDLFVRFQKAFFSRYRIGPEFLNYASFDAMIVLAQAMTNCDVITSDSLRNELLRRRVFESLQYKIEFNATGEADRPVFLFRITNGVFRRM